MLQAKDIMNRKVITVRPEMSVREAADLLVLHRISGAPVVDSGGRLLGVISQTDLVRRSRAPRSEAVPAFYREEGRIVLAPSLDSPDDVPVSQVMTPAVLEADGATPVDKLAKFMLRRRIHRVVIAEKGRLRGIVTSMDMLRAVGHPQGRCRPGPARARRR